MKKIFALLLFSALILNCFKAAAQFNRRDTKKNSPYKTNYQRVSAGCFSAYTLEIRQGTLWSWGFNYWGQLGDGTTTERHSPVQIGTDNKWVNISMGQAFSFGLKSDGTLWAWGRNEYGHLGDGTVINRHSPVQVGSDNKWISISSGTSHCLGIKSDGTLWSWGLNLSGQVGDGSTTERHNPVQIGTANNWTSVFGGGDRSFALKSDGTLWAWGENYWGQLGDGTNADKTSPVQIGTDTKWTRISNGNTHTLGLKSDGTLWAWGYNITGALGDGTTTNRNNPVQIGTANNWVDVSAGWGHSLALKSDGSLWSWGYNASGELGNGTGPGINAPARVGTDNNWVTITTGHSYSLGSKSNGTLWAWGDNSNGQLGDGTIINRSTPVQISIVPNAWVTVDGGGSHTLGVKSNGSLWSWGNNNSWQSGDAIYTQRSFLIQIGTDLNWVGIKGGKNHSLGLQSDGSLWAWGNNSYGQLGVGDTLSRTNPVQVGTEQSWSSIAAGENHSLGLKANGTLWSWGDNTYGQLGDATTTTRTSPVQVGTDNKWISIATGSYHSLGLKANGTLWAWGNNSGGQLGNGTVINELTPVQVGIENKWISIASDSVHTLGMKSDGTIWAWGNNNLGQLGDGTTLMRTSPLQIGTDTKWLLIETGNFHSLGLQSDGNLWTWGGNGKGELGDGTYIFKTSPAQIGTNNDWVALAGGGHHTIALKSERNQFCSTGFNSNGQLGDGTLVNKNTLVCNTNCYPPPPPLNTTPAASLTICSGNSITLTATGSGTLRWYNSAVAGTPVGTGGSYTTPVLTASTTYYVEDSTGVPSLVRTAIAVTVNPAPPIPTISLSGPAVFCDGNSVILTSSSSAAYLWSNGATTQSITITSSTNDSVRITDANGCSSTSAPVAITVNPNPNVIITPDGPTAFCIGGNVTLDAGSGFVTYQWASGPTSQMITLSYTTHDSVTVTDINGCSSSASINVISSPVPVLIINDPAEICSSGFINISSPAITAGSSGGTLSYWQDQGATIPLNPSFYTAADTSGTYYIQLSNPGCSVIQPVNILINNNCVWPGDANHDSIVNNSDLLPIGLHYSQAGAPRASVSNLWQDYISANWGTSQINGSDIKHADCNGDGLIDNSDTLAVNLNFSSTHAIVVNNHDIERLTDPEIHFVTNSNIYNAGDWIDIEVHTGRSAIPVTELYGLAFNIYYDASLVEPGTESLTYPAGWLGTPATNLITISRIEPFASTAFGGITRIDHLNQSGYGEIANLRFQAASSITSPVVLHFAISGYTANDSAGSPLVFNTADDSITITPLATDITEKANSPSVLVHPNPFSEETTISFTEEQKNCIVRIMDVLGKETRTIRFSGKKLVIQKEEMLRGIYFVEITCGNENVINKKIVVQ
ncbi:MAG TPA: T9SS type A sorting domain-containing protein [Bacteroidia bacterium]|jgi:alpha-tubulin suppressor-like RCC1 family protein